MFNLILATALILLLIIVLLPFWWLAPGFSRNRRVVKGALQPGSRRYTIHLPEGCDERRSFPLIIGLHYGGHGLPFYGELFLKELLEPVFSSLGAIIAAPDCPARDWAQPESQLFVEELIEHLKASYPIDPDRVLLIGYSMGGIGCWHLGIERPTNFTAVVIMAAKPPDNILREGWRLPIFVIHGKKDELFPVVDTTRAVLALEEAGVDVHYRILENTSHYETYKFLPVLKEEVKSWLANRWGFQVSV